MAKSKLLLGGGWGEAKPPEDVGKGKEEIVNI